MKKKVLLAVVGLAAVALVAVLLFVRWSSTDLRFGATFPLTGDAASYGQHAKQGIDIAVDEQNKKGGLLGRRVVVEFQDDRNDKKEAVSIATRFVTVDRVPVIFGSAGSTVTLALAPIANQHKVLLVSPISSAATLSEKGGPFFFRTCPADDLQAEILANWVLEKGIRRVAIVYTNNSWGKPLADGFKVRFGAGGGKVALEEGVTEGATDLRTALTKIKSVEGIEAVVSPTYPKEGGVFVRQAKELGLDVPLYGGDNWGSPEFQTIAGDAANGVFYTAPTATTSPAHAEFVRVYKARYDQDPDVFAAYAYDAGKAVFKAIEIVGTADPQAIREAMHKVIFEGASGTIRFKSNGDINAQAFARRTIRGGQPMDVK